jgi:hypothetical protein
MKKSRIIKLEEPQNRTVRFLSGLHVNLEEGKNSSWVTVTRTGKFSDPRYGEFEISRDMLLSMVKNFEARVYGQDVFLDVAHNPNNGAAAKFLKLSIEGDRLRALVEWTPYGIDAVKNKGYAYLSAEYQENFQDNEAKKFHGATLLGAGLTVRPVIKRLDPVRLSCESDGDHPVILHPELESTLLKEITMWKTKQLSALLAALATMSLSQPVIASLGDAFEQAIDPVTDEALGKALAASFEETGKKLAEQIGDKEIKLAITVPELKTGMNADDVKKLLQEHHDSIQAAAKKLTESLEANRKVLSDTINAATGLDDDMKKELASAVSDLITAEMTVDQVKKLAEVQITHGNKLAASIKLSNMGFHQPNGTVHIHVENDGSKKLSGIYHENLKRTMSYGQGQIILPEKVSPFVDRVLAEFDRIHGYQIAEEHKLLASETGMSSTALPVGFQREVIREALSDVNILQLVNTMTDPSATETTQIPYELRDVSAVFNDGIVYEGQEIHRAGIQQLMDTAYLQPMKIAMLISNEVVHLTRASGINWDAMARNLQSNAQYLRELIARRIANELQRSSDAYGAIAVTGEAFDSQLTGSNSIIKTANWPIVRPYQARNMKGDAVGSAENPIAIVLNGVTLSAYDGTGTQSAGTYYRVTNYNLGYIQLVNQLGVAVTPADSGVNTIGYSRATNIVKVDLDVPGGSTLEKQLNKVLQAIGARKAVLKGDRFVVPDFQLMSPQLNDQLTNAEQFVEAGKRQDANVSAEGDLTTVKQLAAYGTNAPGIDLGDERIIIGQRGVMGYTIAKPFAFGEPFEAVGANGKPIGKKQAYGEEYSAIKVPTAVRERFTSVIVASFTGR